MKLTAAAVCIISALCFGGSVCEGGSGSGAVYENVQEWTYPEELLQRARTLLETRGQGGSTRLYTIPRESGPLAFLKRGVMMGVDLPDFIMSSQQGQGAAGAKNIQNLKQRLFQSGRRR